MNDQIHPSDSSDTRATDFVFGELSPEETKQFEIELEQSPELQAEVQSIREAVSAVQAELQSSSQAIGETQRRQIEHAIADSSEQPTPKSAVTAMSNDDGTGTRRLWIGLAVAASVLLIATLAIPALKPPQTVSNLDELRDDPSASAIIRGQDLGSVGESASELEPADVANSETSGMSKRVSGGATINPAATDAQQESQAKGSVTYEKSAPGESKPAQREERLNDQPAGNQNTAGQQAGERSNSQSDLAGRMGNSQPRSDDYDRPAPVKRQMEAPTDTSDLSLPLSADKNEGLDVGARDAQQAAEIAGNQSNRQGRNLSIDARGLSSDRKMNLAPSPAPAASDPGAGASDPAAMLGANRGSILAETEGKFSVRTPKRGQLTHPQPNPSAPNLALNEAQQPGQQIASGKKMDGMSLGGGMGMGGGAEFGGTNAIRGRRRAVSRGTNIEFGLESEQIIDAPASGQGPGMGGDQHDPITDNPFKKVEDEKLSTFSIDVDTAAYSKVRMYLMQHQTLPRPDAVRIEELLNYFTYNYEPPKKSDEHPFATHVAIADCPWNPEHRLARLAIKGRVIEEERPASNLVFLLDVSGSMNRSNKLPLVVEGMKMLTNQLTENDSVAIVVYAGAAGMVLESTCGDEKETILSALERLRAGGSTNGGQGIQLAYDTARDNFITGGTNRVILCTDGDFNVGVTGTDQLVRIAEDNAKSDIFLSVLGFGMGNHNDAMMEQISNKGNGNYAFIDSKKEAQKVLVEQMGGTLVTIAKDVKIQVDFNFKEVAAYRLIGYENRILAAQDFSDDKKDAGEIGAGHTVTALYELIPADGDVDGIAGVDESRYEKTKPTKHADSGESLTLKLRYKQPTGTKSTLIEIPVKDAGGTFDDMDEEFKFAASVASFGMLLRKSPHKGDATFAAVEEIAGDGLGEDKNGRRAEFLEMVRKAKELSGE